METVVDTLLNIRAGLLHPLVLAVFALAGLAWGAGYLTYRKLAFRLRLAAVALAGLGLVAALVLGLRAKPMGPAPAAGSGVDPATAPMPAAAPAPAAGVGAGVASVPAPAVAADPATATAAPVTPVSVGSAAARVGAGVADPAAPAPTEKLDKMIHEAEGFERCLETLVKALREEADFCAAIQRADGLIRQGGTAPVLAARHFQRALIWLLRFDQPNALPDLRKAHELAPDNADYALELAAVLRNQNAFTEAERVLWTLLRTAAHGSGADTPDRREGRARGLNALGMVLQETNRHTEARAQYQEALRIYQDLEAADPERDNDDSTSLRNNLAGLYQETQRFGEAKALYSVKHCGVYSRLADASGDRSLDAALEPLRNACGAGVLRPRPASGVHLWCGGYSWTAKELNDYVPNHTWVTYSEGVRRREFYDAGGALYGQESRNGKALLRYHGRWVTVQTPLRFQAA